MARDIGGSPSGTIAQQSRILAALLDIRQPVGWEAVARAIWPDEDDRPTLRQHWDRNLWSLRDRLRKAGIREDLVRPDGHGNFEAYLLPPCYLSTMPPRFPTFPGSNLAPARWPAPAARCTASARSSLGPAGLFLTLLTGCGGHTPPHETRPDPTQLNADALAAFNAGDLPAALSGWTRACNAGLADACHGAGFVVEQINAGGTGEADSVPWLERACHGKSGKGCALLGLKYAFGRGVAPDPAAAQRYFQTACDLDEAVVGCFNLAGMEAADPSPEAAQRATLLYQRACHAGNGTGCYDVAVLGARLGESPAAAQPWYELGCEAKDGASCAALADAIQATDGLRAAALRAQACTLGEAGACSR